MTGSDLLTKIILSLNVYLNFNSPDVIDLVEVDENLEDGLKKLLSLGPSPDFEKFIMSLDKIRIEDRDGFLNQPYSITGDPLTIDFNQPIFEKKVRSFAYSSTEYSYVSSSSLFNGNDLIELDNIENQLIWKQIEEFLVTSYSIPKISLIDDFFDIISSIDRFKGIVVNKTTANFIDQKHYPFIYLAFLNDSNSIILEDNLKYANTVLYSGLTYDSNKEYDQFFDIYDVLNELNQSKDILNRFLRLYHTFEYLVYRIYLVDLVNRVGTSRILVREFIGASESMKKGEKESFKKNFTKIFSTDLPAIRTRLTPILTTDQTNFLRDKKIVLGFDANAIDKISEFIYGIRCCIVHNKESEYHLTLSNSKDYEVLIPLIKETINVFEELVVKKIADNYNDIKYAQQSINLY